MKIFSFLFKIVVFLVLFCLLVFLGAVVSAVMGWPQWTIPLGIVFFILIILFIYLARKVYYRRREAQFLKSVLAEGENRLTVEQEANSGLLALRQAFEAGLKTLQRSCLELKGNPLTVLPWYLILGPSASGKSTMLNQADLPETAVTFGECNSHIAPTMYCQWRFCRHAVILDTAGRYTMNEDMVNDPLQWQELLRLLSVHRRVQPLDGVVLVLPADLLLNGKKRALDEHATACRLRLEELNSLADKAPPVFIMISKLDVLPGSCAWGELLNVSEKGEALGSLNLLAQSPPVFLTKCLTEVIWGLKDRRLALLRRAPCHSQALQFPAEFEAMAPNLELFFNRLGDNPYQQPLNLRGIFFSSANGGSAIPRILDNLQDTGFAQQQSESIRNLDDGGAQALPDGGLFLKKFFNAILPGERWSSRVRPQVILRQRKHKVLFLGGWLLALLLLLGYSGYSYYHIRVAQKALYTSFSSMPEISDDFVHNSLILSQVRNGIVGLEQHMDQGWFNGFWVSEGQETLAMLKNRFCEFYVSFVLNVMNEKVNEFNSIDDQKGLSDAFAYAYLSNLIWRLDLIASGNPDHLQYMGSQAMRAVIMAFGSDTPDISPELEDMYSSYIDWRQDPHEKERELRLLKDHFFELVKDRGQPWFFKWILHQNYTPPIRLSEFWNVTLPLEKDPAILAAYTVPGYLKVEQLVKILEMIFTDSTVLDQEEFWNFYHKNYYRSWLDLAANFNQGTYGLMTHSDWLSQAETIGSFTSPYFEFLTRMDYELSALNDVSPKPDWVIACGKTVAIISELANEGRPSPVVKKVENLVETTADKAASKVNEVVFNNVNQRFQATAAIKDYLEQLSAFIPGLTSTSLSFQLAKSHFDQTEVAAAEPLPADLALADLKTFTHLLGTGDDKEQVIWDILEGPLFFLASTTVQQAAAQLNNLWVDQVVSPAVYVPVTKLWATLFDAESGLVSDFLQANAKSFLLRDGTGWHDKEWLGLKVPFTANFFSLINSGWQHGQALSDAYEVTIASAPPIVKPSTAIRPTLVSLYLKCASQGQMLKNYNYPAKTTFDWQADTCGDMILSIFFDNFTAQKIWPGPKGFLDFLHEFRNGSVAYSADDFPGIGTVMKAAGLSGVTIRYQITGAEDAIRGSKVQSVTEVPNVITTPWTHLDATYMNEAVVEYGAIDDNPTSVGQWPEAQTQESGGQSL